MMNRPSPSMHSLAQRLLTLEAANATATNTHVHEAARVFEKLRTSLTRFAGADGFTALLRRALVLARSDLPSMQNVRVTTDGRLEGFEESASDFTIEAATGITAHLLGLLATFIGEPLTLRLVRGAWPDASLDI